MDGKGYWRGRFDSDGLITEVYSYLWAMRSEVTWIHFPDTILFERGFPKVWFAWEVSGGLRELKKYLGKDISEERVAAKFAKTASQDVAAEYSTLVREGGGENALALKVEYLNLEGVRQYIGSRALGASGVMQAFIAPRAGSNTVMQAVWSPSRTLVSARYNRHQMTSIVPIHERCVTFDGPVQYSSLGSVTETLRRRVEMGLTQLTTLIKKTEGVELRGVVAYCKVGRDGCLYLTTCTSMRSKHLDITGNRNPVNMNSAFVPSLEFKHTPEQVFLPSRPDDAERGLKGNFSLDITTLSDADLRLMDAKHLKRDEQATRREEAGLQVEVVVPSSPHSAAFIVKKNEKQTAGSAQHRKSGVGAKYGGASPGATMFSTSNSPTDQRGSDDDFTSFFSANTYNNTDIELFGMTESQYEECAAATSKEVNETFGTYAPFSRLPSDPYSTLRNILFDFLRDAVYHSTTMRHDSIKGHHTSQLVYDLVEPITDQVPNSTIPRYKFMFPLNVRKELSAVQLERLMDILHLGAVYSHDAESGVRVAICYFRTMRPCTEIDIFNAIMAILPTRSRLGSAIRSVISNQKPRPPPRPLGGFVRSGGSAAATSGGLASSRSPLDSQVVAGAEEEDHADTQNQSSGNSPLGDTVPSRPVSIAPTTSDDEEEDGSTPQSVNRALVPHPPSEGGAACGEVVEGTEGVVAEFEGGPGEAGSGAYDDSNSQSVPDAMSSALTLALTLPTSRATSALDPDLEDGHKPRTHKFSQGDWKLESAFPPLAIIPNRRKRHQQQQQKERRGITEFSANNTAPQTLRSQSRRQWKRICSGEEEPPVRVLVHARNENEKKMLQFWIQ